MRLTIWFALVIGCYYLRPETWYQSLPWLLRAAALVGVAYAVVGDMLDLAVAFNRLRRSGGGERSGQTLR